MGKKICIFMTTFLEAVWIDKLHYFHDGINFPDNGCHRNRKKAISQLLLQRLLLGRKALSRT